MAGFILPRNEKVNRCNSIPALTEVVENKLIDALQVGYDAGKEGVEFSAFNLLGEVMVELLSREKWIRC